MLALSASARLAAVETPKSTINAAISASEFTTFLVYIVFILVCERRPLRHINELLVSIAQAVPTLKSLFKQ